MLSFVYWVLLTLVPLKVPAPRPTNPDDGGGTEGVTYDPLKYTTGDFMQLGEGPCPAQGRGGNPMLNVLKNRDIPPAHYTPMSLDSIMLLSDADTSKYQSRGVSVEGYFVAAKKQAPEACNCFSKVYVDDHVWMTGAIPDSNTTKGMAPLKSTSLIAELSPRIHGSNRDSMLSYNRARINILARAHRRVKVSGWLMWDKLEKGSRTKGNRTTLWEIHPIHKIEVLQDTSWIPLDRIEVSDVSHYEQH